MSLGFEERLSNKQFMTTNSFFIFNLKIRKLLVVIKYLFGKVSEINELGTFRVYFSSSQ